MQKPIISPEMLEQVSAELTAFRSKGSDLLIFDSRDHGNYGDYEAEKTNKMLRKHDPTGLAEALLLNEKIEATIDGSKVQLSRILREAGYIDQISKILFLKSQLLTEITEPMTALTSLTRLRERPLAFSRLSPPSPQSRCTIPPYN